jgi:hypothetical protein
LNRRVQFRVSVKDVIFLDEEVINWMAQVLLVASKMISAVTNAASAARKKSHI